MSQVIMKKKIRVLVWFFVVVVVPKMYRTNCG